MTGELGSVGASPPRPEDVVPDLCLPDEELCDIRTGSGGESARRGRTGWFCCTWGIGAGWRCGLSRWICGGACCSCGALCLLEVGDVGFDWNAGEQNDKKDGRGYGLLVARH